MSAYLNIDTHDTLLGAWRPPSEIFFLLLCKDNPLTQEQQRRKRLSVFTAAQEDYRLFYISFYKGTVHLTVL